MLEVELLPVLNDNYIYLLHDSDSGDTAIVDPALAEPVLAILNQRGWRLSYVLNTHHHHDHVGGNLQLKQATGCKVVGFVGDQQRIPGLDIAVSDGDSRQWGGQHCQIIATPGHTLGHIVYYFADAHALFCGDTLFSLGCGRLFEGNAEQMWQSLQRLMALPAETCVYCAHEYTQANGRFALTIDPDNPTLQRRIDQVEALRQQNRPTLPSTLGLELATNPFLRADAPMIRQRLAMCDNGDDEVFAKIRALKDHF